MAKIRKQDALDYHSSGKPGKIEVVPTKPYSSQRDLSLAYSPGVAEPCLKIAENPDDVYKYLMQLRKSLKPGGKLAIMGPNFRYCVKGYYDFADHLLPLTHRTIEEHLAAANGCVMTRTSASKPPSHILPSSCSASPRTLGLAVEDERTVKEDSMREET
jgi:hypothetical protein